MNNEILFNRYKVGSIPKKSNVVIIKNDFPSDKNKHRVIMIQCLHYMCKHKRLIRATTLNHKSKPYKNGCNRCHLHPDFALERELKTPLSKQFNMTKEDYINTNIDK